MAGGRRKQVSEKRFIERQGETYEQMIMTSNAPDTAYMSLLQNYRQTLSRFIGPTEILVSGDTLQLEDYSKLDWEWSMFDPEAKKIRRETVFLQECVKAHDMGAALLMKGNESDHI